MPKIWFLALQVVNECFTMIVKTEEKKMRHIRKLPFRNGIAIVCSIHGSGDIIKNVQNPDFQFYKIAAIFLGM